MHQHWRDITFVHWRVDPDRVQRYLPAGVRPDVHDGSSWVGLIPFRMVDAGVGPRRPVPWLGTFLETNVRLYSRDDAGRRGVVFLSLDAQRLPVVVGARLLFGTPYQWARMRFTPQPVPRDPTGSVVTYAARRHHVPGPRWASGDDRHSPRRPRLTSRLSVRVGERVAEPAPLELFLTARFGLHTTVARRVLWVPNTHAPWPLHRAEVLELDDLLVAAAGLPGVTDRPPDSVLFSPGVETSFGRPVRI
ncbi:DUF2071 domain-containing protein [Knoellia sp. 3-2P3]|uniref:YqjF family protein n=1 Tax=unclassified Knoellia TaxID=2618719 RepID=UPI0023DB91B0|nr:DUF2071 domain-containing protein [Knoellia sp. 3-2P3]MDF2092681.1 DUF2071 domain-containing protein [Knoellia sp. 3-2P3]